MDVEERCEGQPCSVVACLTGENSIEKEHDKKKICYFLDEEDEVSHTSVGNSTMNQEDVINYFTNSLHNQPSMSEPLVAIQTLIEFIKQSRAETIAGLRADITETVTTLTVGDHSRRQVTSIISGCELFLRFITLSALDTPDFKNCKEELIKRGCLYLEDAKYSRHKIASLGKLFVGTPFVTRETKILTHSRSRVVLEIFKEAARANKLFKVYVTQSMPDKAGEKMHSDLCDAGIEAEWIPDAAVGNIMEEVDLVLVGAEGVCKNGGIVNKIGTYTIAMCAKTLNKPFYVAAEKFKFTPMFPLNQKDLKEKLKLQLSRLTGNNDLTCDNLLVDYTPPEYIEALFTDLMLSPLTTTQVTDELIKLYL